jgi:hypothetical protein
VQECGDLDLAGGVPKAQHPHAAPTPASAGGNGLDCAREGARGGARVAVDDFSQVAPVDRRHPVTVSFVGEHTLHILRSEWASEKRFAYPTVLKRALSEEPD